MNLTLHKNLEKKEEEKKFLISLHKSNLIYANVLTVTINYRVRSTCVYSTVRLQNVRFKALLCLSRFLKLNC